eukprot:ANDGO_03654.mRNA.1 hypothetical protein AMSG_00614
MAAGGNRIKQFENATNEWATTVFGSCAAEPGVCILGCILPCIPIANHRKALLGNDMTKYVCCNGYHPCYPKIDCRKCTDPCPGFCLCCEGCCCPGMAVITNRFMLQERYTLKNDPCDYCLFYAACVCSLLACLTRNQSFKTLGDLLFCLGVGLFNAQHEKEINVRGLRTENAFQQPQIGNTFPGKQGMV